MTNMQGHISITEGSTAISAIADIVLRLREDGLKGQFNDEACVEFQACADALEAPQQLLHQQAFSERTKEFLEIASKIKGNEKQVRAYIEDLEKDVKFAEAVAQIASFVDDAVTLAAAFKP